MATARPRPQVMRLTDAAAERIKAVMAMPSVRSQRFASASTAAAPA